MNNEQKYSGFSLTEVLIAVGILAVGMIFIAGVFPAGIYLTTIATERTIAAVAADEAFAKIKIYGIDLSKLNVSGLKDFNDVLPATINVDPNEFEYPSADMNEPNQYCWSALCRLTEAYNPATDPNPPVQVTVFVSRKTGPNLRYFNHDFTNDVDWPLPVKIGVKDVAGHKNELNIRNSDEKTFINDGYTIVDDATGRIYRILERYKAPDDTILLDRNWQGTPGNGDVWVVPPPLVPGTGIEDKKCSGRYPCIAVYQKVISF